jgi:Holliday junction resolvasome RuvABC endonuclease subunit
MLILGADVGARTGWALLACDRAASFVACGELPRVGRADALEALIRSTRPDLVAFERPAGYAYDAARVKHLLAAAEIAGALADRARRHVEVVEYTATEWRGALCSRASATNPQVETMVRLRVTGWPAPRKSNEHERDAAGVALYAYERARNPAVQQLERARRAGGDKG